MRKETQILSDLGTGDLYTFELQTKGLDKTYRIIPTRWVTTDKEGGVTRARIVIKARNQDTARSLGISSPTPSADALQVLLGVAGCLDSALGRCDRSIHGYSFEKERWAFLRADKTFSLVY